MRRNLALLALALLLAPGFLGSQSSAAPAPAEPAPADPKAISFMEYDPPSTLVVPGAPDRRGRSSPFVDVHNHQFELDEAKVRQVFADMDALNMAVMVNLSGRGFRRTDGTGRQTAVLAPRAGGTCAS